MFAWVSKGEASQISSQEDVAIGIQHLKGCNVSALGQNALGPCVEGALLASEAQVARKRTIYGVDEADADARDTQLSAGCDVGLGTSDSPLPLDARHVANKDVLGSTRHEQRRKAESSKQHESRHWEPCLEEQGLYRRGMDESTYLQLVDDAFRRLLDAFDDVDVDLVDAESSGDVITLTYRDGSRVVINTQRPARQIWMAGGDKAWHFSWDRERTAWLDDRDGSEELFATLRELTKQRADVELDFG